MMHLLLLASIFIFCTLLLPSSSYARTEGVISANYIVNGNGVRLRAEPTISAREMGKLTMGTAVTPLQKTPTQSTVSGKTAHWYQVKTDQGTGWVFGSFLIPAQNYEAGVLELLRTKLKVESLPFTDAVSLYQLADKAAAQSKSRNAKGELELAKLTALQFSYNHIHFDNLNKSPYQEWYKQHSKISSYDEISGRSLVSDKAFWKLADQYKRDPIGDEITWRASQQPLGGECEGFISCTSMVVLRTEGEYLKRYPKGRYAKTALTSLNDTLKYMLDHWKSPDQDTKDVDLKAWAAVLKPLANTPEVLKARNYVKQLQAMK